MVNLHVGLVTCNRPVMLSRTVEALTDHTRRHNVFIHILDNGQIDCEMLKWLNFASYTWAGKEVLFPGAMPKSQMQQEWIRRMLYREEVDAHYLLCDDDIVVADDWDSSFVTGLSAAMESTRMVLKMRPEVDSVQAQKRKTVTNIFTGAPVEIAYDSLPYAGAFVFMDYEMLREAQWPKSLTTLLAKKDERGWCQEDYKDSIRLRQYAPGPYAVRVSGDLFVHVGELKALLFTGKFGSLSKEKQEALVRATDELGCMDLDEILETFKHSYLGF